MQDLKTEVETTKKAQRETTFGDRKPWEEIRDHRCKYQHQNTRDTRISDAEDTIQTMDSTVKYAKCKELVIQNIQEIQDTMRKLNLRIMGIEESEDLQRKGQVNIFNKTIEEKFSNPKKEP